MKRGKGSTFLSLRVGGEDISKPRKFLGYTSGKLEDFISGMRLLQGSRGKVSIGLNNWFSSSKSVLEFSREPEPTRCTYIPE